MKVFENLTYMFEPPPKKGKRRDGGIFGSAFGLDGGDDYGRDSYAPRRARSSRRGKSYRLPKRKGSGGVSFRDVARGVKVAYRGTKKVYKGTKQRKYIRSRTTEELRDMRTSGGRKAARKELGRRGALSKEEKTKSDEEKLFG